MKIHFGSGTEQQRRDSVQEFVKSPTVHRQSAISLEFRFFEWSAFEVKQRFLPNRTRHVVGCVGPQRTATVTEPILRFDPSACAIETENGEFYTLRNSGLLNDDLNLNYAWHSFVDRALSTSVIDITQELRTAMRSYL